MACMNLYLYIKNALIICTPSSDSNTCVHTDSISILTVHHLYILVPSIWCLCRLPSHHSTVCCIHKPAQTSGLWRDWLRGFFGPSFPISYTESTSLLGKLYYLISPISNFFLIITRTIFFHSNLHRDIRATDPSWTFIRRKKITSQEIKYDHNSLNQVGLYLENFLSLPICSK